MSLNTREYEGSAQDAGDPLERPGMIKILFETLSLALGRIRMRPQDPLFVAEWRTCMGGGFQESEGVISYHHDVIWDEVRQQRDEVLRVRVWIMESVFGGWAPFSLSAFLNEACIWPRYSLVSFPLIPAC